MASLHIISILAFIVLISAYGTYGADDCRTRADACSNSTVYKYFDDGVRAHMFVDVCTEYRTVRQCFQTVTSDTKCSSLDLSSEMSDLNTHINGVCLTSNSMGVAGCALSIKQCQGTFEEYYSSAKAANNITKTCGLAADYTNCVKNALTSTCPKNYASALDDMSVLVDKYELTKGCDSTCGKEISPCVTGLMKIITTVPVNYDSICTTVTNAKSCVTSKTKADSCKSNGTLVTGMLNSLIAQTSDLCNPDGSLGDCASQLMVCEQTLSKVKKDSNRKTDCMAALDFLGCTSNIDCVNVFKTIVNQYRKKLLTTEKNCPYGLTGSCTDMMNECLKKGPSALDVKQAEASNNRKTLCPAAKSMIGCLNQIKTYKICTAMTEIIDSKTHNDISGIDSYCRAAGIPGMSLLVLAIAMLLGFLST